jgi:hypothetical protein
MARENAAGRTGREIGERSSVPAHAGALGKIYGLAPGLWPQVGGGDSGDECDHISTHLDR